MFFKKRDGARPPADAGRVLLCRIRNVGFDSTGRSRTGSQLPDAGAAVRSFLRGEPVEPADDREVVTTVPGGEMSGFVDGQRGTRRHSRSRQKHWRLGDCCTFMSNGRTPARANYTEDGHFILKVGNLSGCGIDWFARDRNFVGKTYVEKLIERRRSEERLIIQKYDLVLTSSAHSVKYIAKKADIVWDVPDFVPGPCPFVAELMLLRPNKEIIDPLLLLIFLRTERARIELQRMARGQTAHLHPDDAADLLIPEPAGAKAEELLALVRKDLELEAERTLRQWNLMQLITKTFAEDRISG